jgi:hypothetical protein
MQASPPRTSSIRSAETYTNPFQIKLPLLRVAHPTDADRNREIEKVKNELAKTRQSQNLVESGDSDAFVGKPSTKGVTGKPAPSLDTHNPSLFNFDHCYDPALTPRKGWQQKVTHLEALYE